MSPHHGTRSAQALYNIFVAPLSVRPLARHPECAFIRPCFSQQSRNVARGKSSAQMRQEKWNDQITAPWIALKDQATGKLQPPVSTQEVLSSLNLELERLVQIVPDQPDDPFSTPICQIVNKKDAFDAAKQRRAQNKEANKQRQIETSVKTIEVNWAIDPHDLELRLSRMKTFLSEGRKVEVIFAAKKRGRRATRHEASEVMNKVRSVAQEVIGARESKPMDGEVGTVAMLFFQGTPQPRSSEQPGLRVVPDSSTSERDLRSHHIKAEAST